MFLDILLTRCLATHIQVQTLNTVHVLISQQTTSFTKFFTTCVYITLLQMLYSRDVFRSELTSSVFASLHTSHYYESLPVCKHRIISDSLSNYIKVACADDNLPGENENTVICKYMITFMCMYYYLLYFLFAMVFPRRPHLRIIRLLPTGCGPV